MFSSQKKWKKAFKWVLFCCCLLVCFWEKIISVFWHSKWSVFFWCFHEKTPLGVFSWKHLKKTLTILSVKKHWGFFIWVWTILHFSSHFACFVFSFWDVSNIFVDRNFASWRIDSHDESHLLYESFNLKVTSEMKMKIKNENFA